MCLFDLANTGMTKHIILITDTQERALIIESILGKADYIVSARISLNDDWSRNIGKASFDAVFIATARSSPKILNGIRRISHEQPRPIVMFVDSDDGTAVDIATQAGVSAYVVDGLVGDRTTRIKAIMSAAIARFNAVQALRLELDETKAQLQERKIIERAKGFLMKQRGYSEDDAYRALRKLAMDRNKRLAEIASNVVSTSELIG